MYAFPEEARRGRRNSQKPELQELCTTTRVQGTEPKSSTGAASLLTCWAISSPIFYVNTPCSCFSGPVEEISTTLSAMLMPESFGPGIENVTGVG